MRYSAGMMRIAFCSVLMALFVGVWDTADVRAERGMDSVVMPVKDTGERDEEEEAVD